MFGWLSSIWSAKLHRFFSGQPPFKICLTLSSIWSVNLVFFPVGSPFSILYGFFPQDFLLHRNVCGCQGSGLNRTSYMVKMGHIYIHMYNLLTILVYMHTYLYIHTTSSYMSHKVHDTKSNSEDYMMTLNKRKTNSRTTVSKVNKPSQTHRSPNHIEVDHFQIQFK